MRKPEHFEEREAMCEKLVKKSVSYFTGCLDAIIDNKTWPLPLTLAGKRYLRMRKVRFHLRTRSEGLKEHFTKPCENKNRINTGGKVTLLAATINCKVKVWRYLKPGRWNGAAEAYANVLAPALKRTQFAKAQLSFLQTGGRLEI
jgi:hypothetical protein